MTSATNHRLAMQELKAQEKAARKAERERQKRVARDEAAERRRAARSGFANVANPRRSTLMTVLCSLFAIYCLFPFVYLLINATKSQADFTSTFGLWFGGEFNLWDNIVTVFTYQDGIFGRWFLNTILYVVVGAGGATLLAIMGGYALAKFRFPGRLVCGALRDRAAGYGRRRRTAGIRCAYRGWWFRIQPDAVHYMVHTGPNGAAGP